MGINSIYTVCVFFFGVLFGGFCFFFEESGKYINCRDFYGIREKYFVPVFFCCYLSLMLLSLEDFIF
jgi:hypothetical protein